MMNIQELATVMHHKINENLFITMDINVKDTQILGFQGSYGMQ